MEAFRSASATLPSKEAGQIRQALRQAEAKQFTKALKIIDKVLEKCPDDGETLALKAAMLNTVGRLEEARGIAKKGLMKNLKSPLCWHSLSMIYNADRNYSEAYKASQKANDLGEDNPTIKRNLSLLQLQMRDYSAFRNSRQVILTNNPTVFVNWVSFIVGEYLCNNLEKACQVIDSFLRSMEQHLTKNEISEVVLFKAKILEEMNEFSRMKNWLEDMKLKVLDSIKWKEAYARALLSLSEKSKAEEVIKELLDINIENTRYHLLLQECLSIKTDDQLHQYYLDLQQKYPKSTLAFRAELDLETNSFASSFDNYLKTRLIKGIPSVFSDIKPLLKDSGKSTVIQNLTSAHLDSLRNNSAFLAVTDYQSLTGEPSETKEQPQVLLWALLFASKLHNSLKNYDLALQLAEEGIEHTPTVPDLYLSKASVLKKTNKVAQATELTEEARKLDLNDRYLNNKHAKYLLKNNQVTEAEEIMGLFSRERGVLNMHEMQSMWYELAVAEAYERLGNYSKAVEEFEYVEKHFRDMYDDQCDFHFYCMRKMNLNSYIEFLEFENKIFSNEKLLRAGKGLIRCYKADESSFSLEKAFGIAKLLTKYHSSDTELNRLIFPIFMKKQKYLQALRCAHRLDSQELKEELQKEVQNKTLGNVQGQILQKFLS